MDYANICNIKIKNTDLDEIGCFQGGRAIDKDTVLDNTEDCFWAGEMV